MKSNKFQNFVQNFFFAPSSGKPLAALRIILAVMMLIEAVSVWPYLDRLYGPYGYLQSDVIEAMTGAAVPGVVAAWGMSPLTYSLALKIFFGLHIAALVGMAIGFQTRFCAVLVWLSQALMLNSGYLSSYGVDRYFLNLSFFLVWLPCAEVWSLDRWRKGVTQPRPAATFGLRMIQIFILMTYFDAGHSKSLGTDWWNGEAIWRVLNQPEFRRFDFLWLAHFSWLAKLVSRGTIFVEMFYFVGVAVSQLQNFWVLSIIAMHLAIAVSMGLSLFGVTLALVNAAIFLLPNRKVR